MSRQERLPKVEVAVAVIARGGRILAVFNPKWGAFTLPMSKRRQLQDPDLRVFWPEVWTVDAARAAAECTGCPSRPELLAELEQFTQSDRDGAFKDFHYQIFRVDVDDAAPPVVGVMTAWLTPDEFDSLEPITLSARAILRKLADVGKLPPG